MNNDVEFALRFYGPEAPLQEQRASAALARTPPEEHAARARLHAVRTAALLPIDTEQAAAAAHDCVAEAERAGDTTSRHWSLLAQCLADLSPDQLEFRITHCREILGTAERNAERSLILTPFFLLLGGLAERGSMGELDRLLSPTGPALSRFPWLENERQTTWFRCLRATIDGQVALAEELADRGRDLSEQSGDLDGQSVWLGQLAIIRWMQGTVTELEPAFLRSRQLAPHELVWAASLAWIWLGQGRKSAARALVQALPPISQFPRDRNWLATLCILATVVAEVGDREIARELLQALRPFEGRFVTIGVGVTCWGTVSRPLALLARAVGDTTAAIGHYQNAVRFSAEIGAHAWLAESQWELAALLASLPGDHRLAEATTLADEAGATGRALQLHGIEDAAATVLEAVQRRSRSHGPVPASTTVQGGRPQIRVIGPFEVRSADGNPARWQSRKARELLKILVARRGAPITREMIMDLLWPGEQPERLTNRMAVAATTVRRALDPDGALPRDAFLETRGDLVRLRTERLEIDVEVFLAQIHEALEAPDGGELRASRLAMALADFQGDVLADEPDAVWAEHLRRDVNHAFFAGNHALAEVSAEVGDQLTRLEAYRRILSFDVYDQRAHEGMIDALTHLGAHGQANESRRVYERRMRELGIEPSLVLS